jgi:hypothetical protein
VPNLTKRLFFYIPFTILAAVFLAICFHFHTAWPWHVPLHEDGHRTFLETILYYEHALGELPLELLLSAALAGWILWLYGPPTAKAGALWNIGIIAVALDATIFVGASTHVGARVAVSYLLQNHTRDSEPMVFGSHWQYHLLAQLSLMLLPALLCVAQVDNLRPIANRPIILISSFASFAILTIIFGISGAPFADARFLGHQARELFTHALVTVPLAIGCCLSIPRAEPSEESPSKRSFWPIAAIVACILLAAYLVAGFLLTRSQHLAQTNDWIKVICGHFFEHTISYLVVTVHSVLFYLLGARRA